MANQFYYIYNPYQANFMVKNNCEVKGVGLGNKNDVYIKFERNDFSETIVKQWKAKEKEET